MPPKKAGKKGKKEDKVADPPPPPKSPTPAPLTSPSPAPLPVLIRSQGGSVADDDFYGEPADATPIGHGHGHSQEQFVERFDEYGDGEERLSHDDGWDHDQHGKNDDFGDTAHSTGGWGTGGGWGTPAGARDSGRNSGSNQGGWGGQSVADHDWESPSQPLVQAGRHPSPAPPSKAKSPPPQSDAVPPPAPTPRPQSTRPPQPSAGQPPHPVWGPYPPPPDGPKRYVSASEMARKQEGSSIPPPPQSKPPQPSPPQQQPNFYPPHPGRQMPPPAGSRASHSASASMYNNWGQPKNVDLWGDPKPGAPPPPPPPKGPIPPPVRQAWQDWGRPPASRSVSGQSAPPPPPPAHARSHSQPAGNGWGYGDDDYSDDESESEDDYGWGAQPAPGAWRTQGQPRGRPASQHPHAKPKVTFSSPVASDAGGTTRRDVLSEQQHDDLYSSLLNTLPQSQLSAHTPRPQSHSHQRHQSFNGPPPPHMHGHGHPQIQHANGWHQQPQNGHPKHGKPKKAHSDWDDDGWGGGGGGGHGGDDGGWGAHGGGWGDDGGNGGWGQPTKDHGGGWGNHDGGWDNKSSKKGQKKDQWDQGNGGWGDAGGWAEPEKKSKGNKDRKGSNEGWGAADNGWENSGKDDAWGQSDDAWGQNGGTWGQPPHAGKGGKGTGSGWGDDWGAGDESDEWEEEDGYEDPWDDARKNETVHVKQRKMSWGDSQADTVYSMPSKTMTHAYNGTYTQPIDAPQMQKMNEYTDIHFLESHTQAFEKVRTAFFGRDRKAKERIHWMFSSDHDVRVKAHLIWLTKVERELGSFGLHKFLQTRERGALFTNVLHRLPGQDTQPTFDWLTFKQVQATLDPIIQDSVIGYDPSKFFYIFVFLPSESGNSVAMWRRKVLIHNDTRLRFQQEIAIALSGLQKEKDYKMLLDQPIPRMSPKSPSQSTSKGTKKAQSKTKTKEKGTGTLTRKNKVVKHQKSKSLPNVAADGKEVKKKRKWWQVLRFSD